MKLSRTLALPLLCLLVCGCASKAAAPPDVTGPSLTVTFDYEKQSGYATNQFAVWIEDGAGNHVKTLYATRFTVNGGYKNRPDSIPRWVEKSGLAEWSKEQTDAVTSATPKAGTLSYVWDLTDADGNAVKPGTYTFFVEGSLRWKNRVLWSGTTDISGGPAAIQATAETIYESSDDQAALTEASPENNMLRGVQATFSGAS
jgi:hypothetical protein